MLVVPAKGQSTITKTYTLINGVPASLEDNVRYLVTERKWNELDHLLKNNPQITAQKLGTLIYQLTDFKNKAYYQVINESKNTTLIEYEKLILKQKAGSSDWDGLNSYLSEFNIFSKNDVESIFSFESARNYRIDTLSKKIAEGTLDKLNFLRKDFVYDECPAPCDLHSDSIYIYGKFDSFASNNSLVFVDDGQFIPEKKGIRISIYYHELVMNRINKDEVRILLAPKDSVLIEIYENPKYKINYRVYKFLTNGVLENKLKLQWQESLKTQSLCAKYPTESVSTINDPESSKYDIFFACKELIESGFKNNKLCGQTIHRGYLCDYNGEDWGGKFRSLWGETNDLLKEKYVNLVKKEKYCDTTDSLLYQKLDEQPTLNTEEKAQFLNLEEKLCAYSYSICRSSSLSPNSISYYQNNSKEYAYGAHDSFPEGINWPAFKNKHFNGNETFLANKLIKLELSYMLGIRFNFVDDSEVDGSGDGPVPLSPAMYIDKIKSYCVKYKDINSQKMISDHVENFLKEYSPKEYIDGQFSYAGYKYKSGSNAQSAYKELHNFQQELKTIKSTCSTLK